MLTIRKMQRCSTFFAYVLLGLFLTGCATHPLGMSDDEWNRLTPTQQLEAHKQEEKNRLERERLQQEKQQRQEEQQLKRDVAEGMIFQFHPDTPYCIGEDKYSHNSFDELILSLQQMAEVDKVLFYADDLVGSKHEGKLSVYADDILVAENIDIKKRGKWHQILVGRPARNITLKAVSDDEVAIHIVKIYGSWTSGDRQFLYIK